jgi:DNA-binding HxlR family transcriptional regulator
MPQVPGKSKSQPRSGCPVSISLEILGDRWSLLIIRDLMVRGFRTFKQFQESGEGIASNILADRWHRLAISGILAAEPDTSDTRRVNYRLTEKGIDLAPVLLELLIWERGTNRPECLVPLSRRWPGTENESCPKFVAAGSSATQLRCCPSRYGRYGKEKRNR